jgi:hypothetical protein
MHFYKQCFIAVVTLVSLSNVANAADNKFRTELDAKSRRSGVGKSSLPLLMRLPGAGRDVVAPQLLKRLQASTMVAAGLSTSVGSLTNDTSSSLIANNAWALRVFADGTRAKFRHLEYLRKHPELIRRATDRMSQAAAETLARAFVENELKEVVKVGSREALVPLKTVYETRQAQNTKLALPEPAEAVSQTVVFTRTVDGNAIIGPGSKVAVQLANDGTVVGFDYDWAELVEAGEDQAVLGLAAITERASALAGLNMAGAQVTTQHFECGYLDLGARRVASGGLLQAACAVHYTGKQANGITGGRVDLVPAGVAVRADAAWPEAQSLCVGGDICKQSLLTPALPPSTNGK